MSFTDTSFETVRRLVYDESAIVLNEGKEYLVESRLTPICKDEGYESIDALAADLRIHKRGLLKKVVEALTTNETSFFRDIHPFDTLRDEVLPALLESRKTTRRLSIWSMACSSGQEPLSLGMLLREDFPELADWDVKILATDINDEILDRCRGGEYSQLEVSRGLPAKLLIKYFQKKGTRWQVKDELLSMIEYRQLNLAKPLPVMAAVDVIFLRNVLIYFDQETKARILEGAHRLLAPDGTLFLGTAESVSGSMDGFKLRPVDHSTCYERVA